MTDMPPTNDPFGQPGVPTPPPVPPTPPQYAAPQQYPPAAPQAGTYYSNQQGYNVAGPKTEGFAIASLVLGCIPCGGITAILAIIFGFVAKSRIQKSNGQTSGKGMATAGVILGILWLVLTLIYVAIVIIVAVNNQN